MPSRARRQEFRETLEAEAALFGLQDDLVYRGPTDFVLQHGQWYTPTLGERLTPRQCYGNSMYMAAVKPGYRYVEGYALAPDGENVIPHAWVAYGTMSYEITWGVLGLEYLGVEFAWERADDCTWVGDACVLDDFHRGWPLLRERWRGEQNVAWPENERVALLRKARAGTATAKEYFDLLQKLEAEIAAEP